jgi:hypothetical protein
MESAANDCKEKRQSYCTQIVPIHANILLLFTWPKEIQLFINLNFFRLDHMATLRFSTMWTPDLIKKLINNRLAFTFIFQTRTLTFEIKSIGLDQLRLNSLKMRINILFSIFVIGSQARDIPEPRHPIILGKQKIYRSLL